MELLLRPENFTPDDVVEQCTIVPPYPSLTFRVNYYGREVPVKPLLEPAENLFYWSWVLGENEKVQVAILPVYSHSAVSKEDDLLRLVLQFLDHRIELPDMVENLELPRYRVQQVNSVEFHIALLFHIH